MSGYKHQPASQRLGARMTLEALVRSVPMLVLVRDLTLLDADRLAASGTILDVYFLETLATVRFGRFHKVALAAEQLVAVVAGKVGDVPAAAFGLRALVREYDLVTSRASRLKQLGVMSATIDVRVVGIVKVDQIDEQFAARLTGKAGRMPTGLCTSTSGEYPDRPVFDRFLASLAGQLAHVRERQLPGYRTAKRLTFPLLAEQLELFQLLGR